MGELIFEGRPACLHPLSKSYFPRDTGQGLGSVGACPLVLLMKLLEGTFAGSCDGISSPGFITRKLGQDYCQSSLLYPGPEAEWKIDPAWHAKPCIVRIRMSAHGPTANSPQLQHHAWHQKPNQQDRLKPPIRTPEAALSTCLICTQNNTKSKADSQEFAFLAIKTAYADHKDTMQVILKRR
ncbi:predicted protein [Uncinocarpus reesii 1704]|uniref:Uncharacterized protein n=1 Tax=Uncinocarpus reesii (strain UAMH 1704) TaxID=336963 RepID=C4JEV1_UNCRE|nr:uncharacterized protein UREG_02261 [Uncinocarpus reesii 1704]EEP77412.1 predicted protein [Uncinocarpus reesii 1704]